MNRSKNTVEGTKELTEKTHPPQQTVEANKNNGVDATVYSQLNVPTAESVADSQAARLQEKERRARLLELYPDKYFDPKRVKDKDNPANDEYIKKVKMTEAAETSMSQ